MTRMQVQLTEEQVQTLRRLSAETGRSIADLIREGVDRYVRAEKRGDRKEQIERALRAIGRFSSGHTDVSADHDRYLAEAFRK